MHTRPQFGAGLVIAASLVAFAQVTADARGAPMAAATLTPNPSNLFTNPFDYSLGFEFLVNQPITVNSLGFFQAPGVALVNPHAVGIFDTAGNLLASTTVNPSDPLTAGFRYHAIALLDLAGGQDYVISAVAGITDPYTFNPTAFTTAPQVAFVQDAYSVSSTLVFPTTTDGNFGYFGPNFTFVPTITPIPEPSSLALLSLGGLALAGWRQWKGSRRRVDKAA